MQQHPGFSEEPRRKFTVGDVLRMVRAGILVDERVELLDGELHPMSPADPPHASAVWRVHESLHAAYGPGYLLWVQNTWRASRFSLLEPDLAVLRGKIRAFEERHPGGKDTVLIVEVSSSSRERDRAKARIYAQAGVPVYWRLDVESRTLEVYTRPARGGYGRCRVVSETGHVRPPETRKSVRVGDLFPSRRHRSH